ncbi:MAG: ZIP family metal transporter [Candidatus Aenigmatarchaeota archaeon]
MMSPLLTIFLFTVLISFMAWMGSLTLFMREELLDKILLVLVALSAGTLTGGAFLHLLPKTVSRMGSISPVIIFIPTMVGFSIFFALEQFIHWHHHHSTKHDKEPFTYMILISDGIHNYIDGLVIAGSFMINFQLGLITSFIVALHEIPQEIGDFGVLVYGGFKKMKALVLNYVTAATVILGGISGYFLYTAVEGITIYILPFAAGSFIYIAASGLIPEIKDCETWQKSAINFTVFLMGVSLMLAIKLV